MGALLRRLAWSLVVIVLHTVVSKGSMQLGDHFATVWIALSSPFNGLIAIMLGDAANVVMVRVKGLRGKKVAAAGAWLLFAAWIEPYTRAGLLSCAFVLTGFAVARALGAALEGTLPRLMAFFLLVEVAGAVVTFLGWRALGRGW